MVYFRHDRLCRGVQVMRYASIICFFLLKRYYIYIINNLKSMRYKGIINVSVLLSDNDCDRLKAVKKVYSPEADITNASVMRNALRKEYDRLVDEGKIDDINHLINK